MKRTSAPVVALLVAIIFIIAFLLIVWLGDVELPTLILGAAMVAGILWIKVSTDLKLKSPDDKLTEILHRLKVRG